LYLAAQKNGRRVTYALRQSYRRGERILWRHLFDLGENPGDYIVYPGGNAFYFDPDLVADLEAKGVADADRKLEVLLLNFLPADIQRIIVQMTRLGRKRRRDLSREAMARAQERLHLFDRRRMFFLRFGRMDDPRAATRPHRFLNALIDKSRDETEYYIRSLENKLRPHEKKHYVYHALDLSGYFPGHFSRLFPEGLDPEELDRAFMTEICKLNADEVFLGPQAGETGAGGLHEYLRPYALLWFDHEFIMRSPGQRVFGDFMNQQARRPPPPPPPASAVGLETALAVFSLTREAWVRATRDELAGIYRRLALLCHPDQGGDSEKFLELNEAFRKLTENK
jgi:hypothetical protein